MKRTMVARSVGRGLAKVEPTSPNTMIAFAAKAGSTASDGDSKNSPFATALVDHLPKPGLDLRKAFGFVRDDVLKNTGFKQEPYVYGSLGGDDVPLVPAKPVAAAGPSANARDATRRDYELALQLGTRDGWTAFLAQYPDGFYTNLARGQINKIGEEETRTAANKTRQGKEKAGLAADRDKKTGQEEEAASAKAAEDDKIAAKKLEQNDAVAGKMASDKADAENKVATLTPATAQPTILPPEITKLVQSELHRVGCLSDATGGEWTSPSQRSLALFNKYAGTKLDVKLASIESLDAIRSKQGRVCPLTCERGFKADGDSCVKIICRTGLELGGDGSCKPIESNRHAPPPNQDKLPSQTQPTVQNGDGSCSKMQDPLGCNCALKAGGYIYPSTRSHSGYRFRATNYNSYYMCLYAAGRR
jgi:hypothetical protein